MKSIFHPVSLADPKIALQIPEYLNLLKARDQNALALFTVCEVLLFIVEQLSPLLVQYAPPAPFRNTSTMQANYAVGEGKHRVGRRPNYEVDGRKALSDDLPVAAL